MGTLLTTLAANGPWALVAGFLLTQLIKAWTKDRLEVLKAWKEDRDQLTSLLGSFQTAIEKLETAVTKLSERLDRIEVEHRRSTN